MILAVLLFMFALCIIRQIEFLLLKKYNDY